MRSQLRLAIGESNPCVLSVQGGSNVKSDTLLSLLAKHLAYEFIDLLDEYASIVYLFTVWQHQAPPIPSTFAHHLLRTNSKNQLWCIQCFSTSTWTCSTYGTVGRGSNVCHGVSHWWAGQSVLESRGTNKMWNHKAAISFEYFIAPGLNTSYFNF